MLNFQIKCLSFAIFFVIVFQVAAQTPSADKAEPPSEIRVCWSLIPPDERDDDEQRWQVLAMVRPSVEMQGVAPEIDVPASLNVESIFPEKADLSPERFSLFYILVSSTENGKSETQKTRFDISLPDHPHSKQTVELARGFDLISGEWESYFAGTGSTLSNLGELPNEQADWKKLTLPGLWADIGITWIRIRFFVPEKWNKTAMSLAISAIDDNDITFLNGKEIGRTQGWNTPRNYEIFDNLLKFGEKNELLIAVENTNHGGGILHGPIWLGQKTDRPRSELFPEPKIQNEADRQSPRAQGKAAPLRPMKVRDGVLEYDDGGEVALWGVNYYPQSWDEYRYLKEQGIDIKKAINADLDDLLGSNRDENFEDPRRINAIRIHVFDSEIYDLQGRLVHNEHLDLLDYLVAQCNERGVYLWLTPIAWWGSPQGLPDCFANRVPMQAMTLCKETWPAQQRYLKSFLEHENPYTKRRLVDEPCLVLFEIINEPLYWSMYDLLDLRLRPHGRVWCKAEDEHSDKDPNITFRKKIREEWNRQLPNENWESPDSWNFYQYACIREYIDTMHETIRSTGARQPIAYSSAKFNTHSPAFAAVGDSCCEAVTLVLYTGLEQKPVSDAQSQLPKTADSGLPVELASKARLVYEFDASDTLRQIDIYPALARHFRNLGVQVACQFQYDSRFNADHNRAWATHYLNAVHTPERFVGFLIGGETFRSLNRGTTYKPENPDEWIFPPTALSYSRNAALLSKDKLYMQARPVDWKPFEISQAPQRIIAVGSTPFYGYGGTGFVDLEIAGDSVLLDLGPDVERLKDDTLRATPEDPLTRLKADRHRLILPGWEKAIVEIETDAGWKKAADSAELFQFKTGNRYRLKKSNILQQPE